MGVIGIPIALLLFVLIPSASRRPPRAAARSGLGPAFRAMGTVFINPQSILCGLIAGLMFIPTTIFDMVWGVRFLQEAHDMPYSVAVLRSAAVRSDGSSAVRFSAGLPTASAAASRSSSAQPGAACALALILYAPPGLFPPYSLAFWPGLRRAQR